MQCMTYTNASAGNNKLLKPQTNCKLQLSSNFVYISDVPECILCSARFAKVDLFTFLGKEKKKKQLPADMVFTLILPFRPAS